MSDNKSSSMSDDNVLSEEQKFQKGDAMSSQARQEERLPDATGSHGLQRPVNETSGRINHENSSTIPSSTRQEDHVVTRTGEQSGPGQSTGNRPDYAQQDYRMQLELLEEQNKKTLMDRQRRAEKRRQKEDDGRKE